jgi:hypothetical protein
MSDDRQFNLLKTVFLSLIIASLQGFALSSGVAVVARRVEPD